MSFFLCVGWSLCLKFFKSASYLWPIGLFFAFYSCASLTPGSFGVLVILDNDKLFSLAILLSNFSRSCLLSISDLIFSLSFMSRILSFSLGSLKYSFALAFILTLLAISFASRLWMLYFSWLTARMVSSLMTLSWGAAVLERGRKLDSWLWLNFFP